MKDLKPFNEKVDSDEETMGVTDANSARDDQGGADLDNDGSPNDQASEQPPAPHVVGDMVSNALPKSNNRRMVSSCFSLSIPALISSVNFSRAVCVL